MKVPRVLQVVLQLDPGGTERLVVELVSRLHSQVPMAVCCLDSPGAWAPRVEALGVHVIALNRRPGFRPSLAWRIAAAARAAGANVLHCHHYSPFVYGRLAALTIPGCRVIYTEHGRLSDALPSSKRRLVNRLLTVGVRDLIAVSHDLRAHLHREAMPVRMKVVWNGIDPGEPPSIEARAMARAQFGADGDHHVVVSVARLDPVKDLSSLIHAVALTKRALPKVKLVLVGGGPERRRLEAVAADAGIAADVLFLGHRDDARQLLAGADAYANSSASEGISLTILEAMAAELPVVATRVGGTPEIVVDGETGRLVPARDRASLAAALGDLGRDAAVAQAMGKSGRRRVLTTFTIDRMVNDYLRIYANVGRSPGVGGFYRMVE